MLRLLTTVLIIFSFGLVFLQAQRPKSQTETDSLKNVLSQDLADTIKAKVNLRIADYYLMMNTDSAIYYGNKSLEIAQNTSDKIREAHALARIGIAHSVRNEFATATEYLVKAQRIFDEYPDPIWLGMIYNEYGIMHLLQKQFDDAIPMYLKSIEYKEQVDDSIGISKTLNNIAGVYQQKGQLDSSLYFYNESMKIKEQMGYTEGVAYTKSNISSILFKQGKYKQSLAEAQESLAMFEGIDNRDGKIYVYNMLADNNFKLGDYDKAIEYRMKALEEAKKLKILRRVEESHNKLADIYEAKGDYAKALYHERLYRVYKDSVDNEKNIRRIEQVKAQYEIDKREAEIAQQDAELAKQANERNALIGGVILLVIIAALIFRNQRIKTKSLKEKEYLLKEIHHRVKNNLQVISSLLNMQSREANDPEMLDVIKEGQSRVKAMSLIHQKLYQTDDLSEISFEEYAQQLIDQLSALYKRDGLELEKTIDAKDIRLDIDTAIPLGLILNELISNSFKYAFNEMKKGELQISLERTSKEDLKLVVSDNGSGLPVNLDLSTVKSLGLKLVNILTKQLKGSMDFSSENGARFEINFKDLRMSA
ncbi:tetratricopeptide repeat-containing sensor histidine kinase [Ekhidna sp. To15]|uniref:tetratricopeptide repeat-containing sensor histidine kinase n=1 Tax=Ekhidna sp. To15 TaxID=3395267 RepID=UPI003F51BAAD